MARANNTISLVINTKNEEKNIKDCIASAKEIVDEIIVVDMASMTVLKFLSKIYFSAPG
jgi:cellulose synthase/poly-beta-1,6-N-acetylglucosamine synthase-like glycosyltransferase